MGTVFGFIFSNFKLIIYSVGGIALAYFLWTGYNIVVQNAKNEILIQDFKKNEQVFQQALKDKEAQIALQNEINKLANDIVTARDDQINQLTKDYENIVNNSLGPDLDSPAAASLKELIRELQKKG